MTGLGANGWITTNTALIAAKLGYPVEWRWTVSDTPRTDAEAYYPHDSNEKVCEADFCRQLERELNAANSRIRQLIAERDTARLQADRQVSLREEFRELLGTDKIEEGVAAVQAMKARIKHLEDRIERASIAFFTDGSDRQTATAMLAILEEERNNL